LSSTDKLIITRPQHYIIYRIIESYNGFNIFKNISKACSARRR